MQNITHAFIGVDVSKKHLDICPWPERKTFRVENTKHGLRQLGKRLTELDIAKIMLEASGGYERLAIVTLSEEYPVYRVNPKRVFDFRKAKGTKAKTDDVDAILIGEFAANDCSENVALVNTAYLKLQDNLKRKQDLKKMIAKEKNRLEKTFDPEIKKEIQGNIKFLKKRLNKYDKRINGEIELDPELQAKKEIVMSMPGVGNETAQAIIVALPEAGNVGNKEIASLAGLAPQTNESGQFVGKARINNGRCGPRRLLYMAALSAIKFNPKLKAFYERLRKKGKPFKVAIAAVMRKMLVILNIMLSKNEMWNEDYGVTVAN